MFSIRQLYILVALGYTALLFIAMLMLRAFWFYPQEVEQALYIQQNEVHSFLAALELRDQQLSSLSDDYAIWNQSVDFTDTSDPEYLSDNFGPETFDTQSLAAAAILDRWGKPLFYAGFAAEELIPEPDYLADWLSSDSVNFMPDTQISSIELINQLPHLVSSSAIRLSEESTDIHGWMILIRRIDPEFIRILADVSRLQITLTEPPYAAAFTNLRMPIQDVQAARSGCITNNAGAASLCVTMQHGNGAGPSLINTPVLLVFLLISIIPAIIFIMLLKVIIDPIEYALKFLNQNNSSGQVRPLIFSKSPHVKELVELKKAFNQLVMTSKRQQIKLERISNTDRLTDISNRRAFDEALDKSWRRIQRHPQSIALILVDIDYFKNFNDHYGHQAGDSALQQVANALAGCTRRTDEIAARFGGEEFALIMEAEDATALNRIRQRMDDAIHSLHIRHDYSPASKELTVSYGIAWIRDSGPWLEEYEMKVWLRAADAALYEAKAAGRDCNMLQILSRDVPLTESPVLQQLPG